MRDVDVAAAAKAEHQDRPRNHERVSDEQDDRGVRRKLEPFITRAAAGKNSADTEENAEIPKSRPRDEQQWVPQGRAREPRHQPDRGPDSRHRRPAEEHRVHVRRPHPTPGEEAPPAQQIGHVEFERGQSREQRADQKPDDRGSVEHQDRHAGRSVNQRALHLLDVVARDFVRGGLGFGTRGSKWDFGGTHN